MFNNVVVNINTDCFINHHYHIYFEKKGKQIIRAYEADFKKKRNHIISTMGEYFEREILVNEDMIIGDSCQVVSMINGNKRNIPLGKIVFVDQFVDSCGMASHYLSEEVLWNAYKEYFERQSFISTFLYELDVKKIIIDKNLNLKEIHNYLLNYIDGIKYYEISLSKDIFVVLAIGIGKNKKAAGLGTSRDLEKAVEKSQKEILQYFAVSKSKGKSINTKIHNENQKDIYHTKFDELTVMEFKNYYSFLNNSKSTIIVNEEEKQVLEKKQIIRNNFNTLNMEPYIAMFENKIGNKIVKMYDFKWFPHMRPGMYNNEIYENVSNILNAEKKKQVSWIPFA